MLGFFFFVCFVKSNENKIETIVFNGFDTSEVKIEMNVFELVSF